MSDDPPSLHPPPGLAVGSEGLDGGSASAPEICATCRLPLTRRGARGECLRCALRLVLGEESEAANDEETGDAPTVALLGRPEVRPGGAVMRYGHFEVAVGFDGQPRELGSGAMAMTYRALDTVLRLPVALKVISHNVAGQPAARARFLREARAAAKLHHPNVASVTFYGEQAGECFYAMELVEGETLAERVGRIGVFAPAQALEVGVQVARALAAAEAVGVVHRDLKPSNLMLVALSVVGQEDGTALHVKVIDWGLAKAVSAEDVLLGADHTRGGFVGTPAFASPEQFGRGEKGQRVDVRSDIYSLGVTLWFLLCGKTPFVGDTLEAIHARQRALPIEQLRAARVPAPLAGLLRDMVAFDPARRPQSARELLDKLAECQGKHLDEQTHRPIHGRLRRWQVAAAVFTLVLLASAGAWWRSIKSVPVAGGTPSLAVLPFENLDPEQADAFFTIGMQDEITSDLARLSQLTVLSPESAASYPPSPRRDYPAIGQTLGVKYLLEGSVRRIDGQVRITVCLRDAHQAAQVWTHEYEGGLSNIFSLQGQIAHAVADRLQVPLTATEKRSIEHNPTTDPQAHDLYLRATTMQPSAAQPDDWTIHLEMVALLDAAVARDPNFVLAYCALSEDQIWLYENRALTPPGSPDVDRRSLADVALAKARRLEPESGEMHLATAWNLFVASHDDEQTRIEVDLARRTLPNDREVEQLTGQVAYCQGRWPEALRSLERAAALNPLDAHGRFDLANYYRHLRQYRKFDQEMSQAVDNMPAETASVYRVFGALGPLEESGNLNPLRNALAALPPANDPSGRVQFRNGFLLHLFERDATAAARTLAGFTTDPIRSGTHLYPRAWFEAQLARLRKDDVGAQVAFTATREWMDKQSTAHPTDGWTLSMLAVCEAALGHKESAVREAKRAVELEPYGRHLDYASFVRGNLALVYAWTAQPELALEVLESLGNRAGSYDLPAQPSYGDLQLNPCWDSLRGQPRFATVVELFARPVLDSTANPKR